MPRRFFSSAAVTLLLVGLSACADEGGAPVPPSISIAMPSDGGGDAVPSDGGGEPAASDGGGDAGSDGGSGAATPDVPPPNPDDYPHRDLRTPEGAEQTVRYYVDLVYWGRQTGDSQRLTEIHGEECVACNYFTESIDSLKGGGSYWQGVEIYEGSVEVLESEVNEHEVAFMFSVSEHIEPDPESGELALVSSREFLIVAGLNWQDGQWSIDAMSFKDVTNGYE